MMSESKATYVSVAKIISDLRDEYGYDIPAMLLAHRLAEFFETRNPAFRKAQFLRACGELVTGDPVQLT